MLVTAHAERQQAQERLAVTAGWYAAAMTRQRRLPDLARVLGEPEVRVIGEDDKTDWMRDFDAAYRAGSKPKLRLVAGGGDGG